MINKILKVLTVFFLFALALNFKVNAENPYDVLGESLEEIENFNGYEILEDNGLTLENENFAENLTPSNIFEVFKELINNGYKTPLTAFLAVAAITIITAACSSFLSQNRHFLSFLTIAAAATVLLPLFNTLVTAANTLNAVSNFMLSFVPVFLGVVISNGFIASAKVSSPIIMFAASFVSKASTTVFLPLMGGYLSLNISSSVSPVFSLNSFAVSLKNAANYVMGFCTTLFLGVLSLSSNVSSSNDSLALKTTRYLVNGMPVVGGAIAESLSVTISSLALLKTGVGAFGILAVAVILLPSLITLLFWKGSLFLSSFITEILDLKVLSDFLKGVSAVVSVTIGIIIFVGLLFIISLAILVGLRR